MITMKFAQTMASYNYWMNDRLYASCAELSDEERKRDRGAFFHSIHGTLNHILLADRVWMGRFTGEPYAVKGLDQELYSDYSELNNERRVTDQAIADWAKGLTDETLAGQLRYTSLVNPEPRTIPLWVAVTHLFNHQTHHRGQITTLLSQAGKDMGVTDLMWLPEVVSGELA